MQQPERIPFMPSASRRGRALRGLALLLISVACYVPRSTGMTATYDVQIEDYEFIPHDLVIAPGDTVVWHANAADHTVTADDLSFDSSPPPDVVTIPSGTTFSHTFPAAGVNHYYCRIHGGPSTAAGAPAPASVSHGSVASSVPDSMNGIVRVAEPGANTAPGTPL